MSDDGEEDDVTVPDVRNVLMSESKVDTASLAGPIASITRWIHSLSSQYKDVSRQLKASREQAIKAGKVKLLTQVADGSTVPLK